MVSEMVGLFFIPQTHQNSKGVELCKKVGFGNFLMGI